MKIAFVQPPVEDFYHTRIRTYPLGLLYLATKIRDLCEVSIIDLRKGNKPKKSQNPFPDLSEYYSGDTYSPFSLFKNYKRYGATEIEIEKLFESEMPDILCVSSLFSCYSKEAVDVAKIAKRVNDKIITVFGGHHATALPDLLLRESCVDYVIRGEGETPLFQLVRVLEKKKSCGLKEIEGLCFKKNGKVYVSNKVNFESDIDMIPERRFLSKEDYKIGKKTYTFFLTSRGCPYGCAFCSKMSVPYRERSLKSIESEIEILKSQGIDWIDFEDDMLILKEDRFVKILNVLKKNNFSLSAMNGIYIESLTERILNEMIEAGFRKINLSIVDLSPCILKGQKRQVPRNINEMLSRFESSELLMEIHFIIGLPNQCVEDVLKTMWYLSEKRCLLGPSVFYLSPNNRLVDKVLGSNWTEKLNYLRSSVLLPASPSFSRRSLFTLMKLSRFINFVKRFVDSKERSLSLKDIRLPDALDDEIFAVLLKEKRFVAYDPNKNGLFEEPQDKEIVERFFSIMEGKKVKGYKTPYYVEFRIE